MTKDDVKCENCYMKLDFNYDHIWDDHAQRDVSPTSGTCTYLWKLSKVRQHSQSRCGVLMEIYDCSGVIIFSVSPEDLSNVVFELLGDRFHWKLTG
jgi:hypothetical protein